MRDLLVAIGRREPGDKRNQFVAEAIEGSEQGGTRPAVIISSDLLNNALPIVATASITSRKTDRIFKTEVLIEPPEGGLTHRSKVILYQTRAITKARAAEELGLLTSSRMAEVDTALRRALGLDG